MLPDRLCRMLTAYVDGELDDDQRKIVLKLLRRSGRARNMLRQLQGDADCLRQLSRPVLGRDVSAQVVQVLDGDPVQPNRSRFSTANPGLRAWRGMAIAATVLLVLGLGAYLHLAAKHQAALSEYDARLQVLLAQVQRGVEMLPVPGPEESRIVEFLPNPKEEELPALPLEDKLLPPAKKLAEVAPSSPPLTDKENRLGSSIPSIPKLKTPAVELPFFSQLRGLEQDKVRNEFTEELRKGKPRRMDLACSDVPVGMKRLEAALAKQGIGWLIDHDAENLLKLGLKSDYAAYIDSVSPEDIVSALRHLRNVDRETEAKRRNLAQFEEFVLNAFGDEDRRILIKLLGKDPTTAKRTSNGSAGQGSSKASDRLALVVPYDPDYSRSNSPEVMQFLQSRKERPAGTIPMLLIVHRGK